VGINIKSFDDNGGHYIIDTGLKKKELQNKHLFLDELVIKIIISIEVTHCEVNNLILTKKCLMLIHFRNFHLIRHL